MESASRFGLTRTGTGGKKAAECVFTARADIKQVVRVGTFIADEASKFESSLGGESQLDLETRQFSQTTQYSQKLAELLRAYVPVVPNLALTQTPDINDENSSKQWDQLADRISEATVRFADAKSGTWHQIWYKMGDVREVVDAWISIIPSDYGLAVVKTALAMVFKLAENSKDKTRKILDTFGVLKDTIKTSHPELHLAFREDKNMKKQADLLYMAIVESLEALIVSLFPNKEKEKGVHLEALKNRVRHFGFGRSKTAEKTAIGRDNADDPEPPLPSVDGILARLNECRENFKNAESSVRDMTIAQTGRGVATMGQQVLVVDRKMDVAVAGVGRLGDGMVCMNDRVKSMGGNLARIDSHVSSMAGDVADLNQMAHEFGDKQQTIADQQTRQIASFMAGLQMQQRNLVMEFMLERESQKRENELLREQLLQRSPQKGAAVVDFAGFLRILALPAEDQRLDIRPVFAAINNDLEQALAQQGIIKPSAQAQVQSMLQNERFQSWLNSRVSDLVLVEANIGEQGMLDLSATAVFCATLVTSLMALYRSDVVTFFFCPLHVDPREDVWFGARGLVRAVAAQLAMRLQREGTLDLDFVGSHRFAEAIEARDPDALGCTLRALLNQFSPGRTIYCIVDNVASFDNSWGLQDLAHAVAWLQRIVDDDGLRPMFKVLMTNPNMSTYEIRALPVFQARRDRLVTLSLDFSSMPGEISERVMASYLPSRASTPVMGGARLVQQQQQLGWSTPQRNLLSEWGTPQQTLRHSVSNASLLYAGGLDWSPLNLVPRAVTPEPAMVSGSADLWPDLTPSGRGGGGYQYPNEDYCLPSS